MPDEPVARPDVPGVQIRRAARTDVAALADLASRTWEDEFGSSLDPDDLAVELQTRRSPEYFQAALQQTTVLVADDGGRLVGYVQFGPVDIPEVNAREGDRQLRRLYVDRVAQGRGLGRRLIKAALAHPELAAAGRVYLSVWEENDRALRLYESVGFRRVGMTTYSIGDKLIGDDLVLCLDRGVPSD
jgi:ribosomal protein S18 acetylase RimI-like enzyme